MKAVSTDLGLTFEARKIVIGKIPELFIPTFHNNSFNELSEQILVVERNKSSFVL